MPGAQAAIVAAPMGTLDFIASVTASLAWPIAAFAIAFLLRNQIRGLLGRLNEIGFGDAKATFAKTLDSAERKAESLPPSPETLPGFEMLPVGDNATAELVEAEAGVDLTDKVAVDLAHRRLLMDRYGPLGVESARFAALLAISPAAAMLDTFRSLERSLFRVVERLNVELPGKRASTSAMAYGLVNENIIPNDIAKLIVELQVMRNSAAHGSEPSEIDAIRFREIANRVVRAISDTMRKRESDEEKE